MVFVDLDLNRVQQMRFAQTGRSVNEQRIVSAGRVCRNRLRRRKGKLVGRAADEVFKGEIIPARGQAGFIHWAFFFGSLWVRLRHSELDLNIKAKYSLKRILQQTRITVRHDLTDKIIADFQRDAVGIFKADRFQPADVILVRRVGSMFAAIGFGRVQYVVE